MSTLQVANVHFETTGNNRLQYVGSNTYHLVAGGSTAAVVNTTTFYANLNFDVAGTFKVNNNDINPLGQQTIWVPAVAMYPRATNGAVYGSIETTTNKVMLKTLDFDTTTVEYAQFAIQMPKSWNEATGIIPQFVWTHGDTTVDFGVTWAIQAVAIPDNSASDVAFGTAVSISDLGGVTNNIYISGEASPFTVEGNPSPEEWVVFQVWRNPANISDTLAVDARLLGVKLHYTVNAAKDD